MERRVSTSDLGLALGLYALVGLIIYGITLIPAAQAYAQVGPKLAPIVAAAGLGVLATVLLIQALLGGWPHEGDDVKPDRRALAWLGGALVLNVALIDTIGFKLASAMLFVLVARAFGSRRLARDLAIGALLVTAAYFAFRRFLGIDLGAGVFKGLL
jgi:putative tricarboxylic transport membrane protein